MLPVENSTDLLDEKLESLGFVQGDFHHANSSSIPNDFLFFEEQAKSVGATFFFLQNQLKEGVKIVVLGFDFSNKNYDSSFDNELKTLQNKVWLKGISPLMMVVFEDEVRWMNSSRLSLGNDCEVIEIQDDVKNIPLLLKTGVFWELEELKSEFSIENTLQYQLEKVIKSLNNFSIEKLQDKASIFLKEFILSSFNFEKIDEILSQLSPENGSYFKEIKEYIQSNFKELFELDLTEIPTEILAAILEKMEDKTRVHFPLILNQAVVYEALPLKRHSIIDFSEFKILVVDGNSLSLSFLIIQRLTQVWRLKNELKQPDYSDVLEILSRITFSEIKLENKEFLGKLIRRYFKLEEREGVDFQILFDDFLETTSVKSELFDIVVGNALFINQMNYEIEDKWLVKNKEIPFPKGHISINYAVQGFRYLKPSGTLSLFVDGTDFFYHQKSAEFNDALVLKHNVYRVYNLTNYAWSFQDSRATSGMVIFARNEKPDCCMNFLHHVVKPSLSAKAEILLTSDIFDDHYINKQDEAINPVIWKNDLLGGGRVRKLVKKLRNLPTIGDYLASKSIEFTKSQEKINFEQLLNWSIKVGNSTLKLGDSLVFNVQEPNGYIGKLYDSLIHNKEVYKFYIFATHPTILASSNGEFSNEDFLKLPFLEDTLNISESERKVIYESLTFYSNSLISNSPKAFKIIESSDLKEVVNDFSTCFLQEVNSLFGTNTTKFQLKDIFTVKNSVLVAVYFYSSDEIILQFKDLDSFKEIPELSNSDIEELLAKNKIIRLYPNQETIVLIKPKQHKYWGGLSAFYDADKYF